MSIFAREFFSFGATAEDLKSLKCCPCGAYEQALEHDFHLSMYVFERMRRSPPALSSAIQGKIYLQRYVSTNRQVWAFARSLPDALFSNKMDQNMDEPSNFHFCTYTIIEGIVTALGFTGRGYFTVRLLCHSYTALWRTI
jgi:hypothetical protein